MREKRRERAVAEMKFAQVKSHPQKPAERVRERRDSTVRWVSKPRATIVRQEACCHRVSSSPERFIDFPSLIYQTVAVLCLSRPRPANKITSRLESPARETQWL